MESRGNTKHKGWWIAGGLTTLFVFSQMGGADQTRVEPKPTIEPVAAYAAPRPDTMPADPAPLPTVDVPPEDTIASEPVAESDVAPDPEPEQDTANEQEASFVYYRNCSAARAAGAAPISVGEPGYARKLDRDGDGIACE